MKRLIIITGIMLLSVSALAFQFAGSGGVSSSKVRQIVNEEISGGLNFTQRQMSSGTITLLPPFLNDPTGIRGLDITVAKGSNRAGHLQYSSGKLLVDHAEIAGTGGTTFATVKRSVLTNMSSGKLYEAGAFAKHTLPSAAASKSVRVFANASSARVSVNTESGVIKDFGGITSTAGYSVRVPKGSVYEFFSTAADNTWYAIKQAGTAITQYVLEFIASLSLDSSSTDHGSVAVGGTSSNVTHTVYNTGGASATNIVFTNTSSALFRNVSSACGSTLAAGANCIFKTAYTPLSATTNSGHINITADGGLLASLALSGTGTSSCAGYKVTWPMIADGLSCYDADDGSTTTTSGITYTAEGMETNANSDYVRFNVTAGNSIDPELWEIGFRYKSVGTPTSYAYFVDHSVSANELAIVRNSTSNNAFRIYMNGQEVTLTSTVSNFYNGVEHTLVVTYNGTTNTATISIDGETPVSGTLNTGAATITSGYLQLGSAVAGTSNVAGIMSDFYIK